MKIIYTSLCLFFLCLSTLLFGQNNFKPTLDFNEQTAFVYLFNKKLITGNSITLTSTSHQPFVISIDQQQYIGNSVLFYQNENGLFANTYGLSNTLEFARCIEKGKINLYVTNKKKKGYYHPVTKLHTPEQVAKNQSYYYNSDFDNLKIATFKTLETTLSNNIKAMTELQLSKRKHTQNIILRTIGGVLIAGSALSFVQRSRGRNPEKGFNPGREIALISSGALISWFAGNKSEQKKQHLRNAVKYFNENQE